MRFLGLDLGERRVGVAVSDEIGMLAHPVKTIEVTGDRSLVDQVNALVREHAAEKVIVGLPLNQDGSMGPRAQRVDALTKLLAAELPVPIEQVDERFSSQAASRDLMAAPKKVRRDKGAIDRLAAVYILQTYLDTHR